ncbi:hypothetical protein HHI36_016614 [Cryptolaemus montrouzieri]|uniref:Small RNA 2'-O-methyltransferase n=1 Tax=Cryptolaemus montrouzieri TaxID=559131 RepID=A0ABD2NKL7_9CUCU
MIVIFHCASLFIRYIIKERRRRHALYEFQKIQENIKDINSACSSAYRDAEQDLKFDPPVYRQRYGTIHDVLLNAKWRKDLRKIVEFGCAEFGLFIFIKNLIGIEEINFVDIDEQLLKDNLFRVRPLTCEYLRRRPEPLTINVFAGSIIDPDRRILDSDVVIGIEIIEHLYPDILEAVPYTIFHCIQPKLAIFTTPNADFNELLPNLKKFRHYDHKFEWSREQFQSWATNITERFPQYFASFHGIGAGPKETQYLGSCSQMVVFVRRDVVDTSYILSKSRCFCRGDMKSENKLQGMNKGKWDYCVSCCPMQSYGICTYYSYANHFEELKTESQNHKDPDNLVFYKLLQTEDFPFYKDDRTQEQKLLDELKYKIYNLGNVNGRFFNVDKFRSEIPLVMLTTSSLGQFISESEVRTLLSSQGYKLEECRTNEEDDEKQLCVIYEPEMENSSSSESEASGYESGHSRFLNEASLSDWDDDDSPNQRDGQKDAWLRNSCMLEVNWK